MKPKPFSLSSSKILGWLRDEAERDVGESAPSRVKGWDLGTASDLEAERKSG